MPYKDLASGNYFIARVYDSNGIAGFTYRTYQDIPDANTLYALSGDFSFGQALNYDAVNNKFYAQQNINEVSTTIEVNVLPLSPPVDVQINDFILNSTTKELSILYNSTQVRAVTVERYRNVNGSNNWDVIDTVTLQSGDGLVLTVTVPQAVIDLSATVDKIIFRLTDASLSVKALLG
jgi:hypothetical protein